MVRAELAGEQAPEMVVKNTQLELRGGRYAVRFSGEVVDQGSYSLNGGNSENLMILKGESGPNFGKVIPCIFQLAENRLQVCYGLDGSAPKSFSANAANNWYLATYRRNP